VNWARELVLRGLAVTLRARAMVPYSRSTRYRMRLPNDTQSRILAAIAELDPSGSLTERLGHRHSLIPLYADMGGAILLRADGVLLEVLWDSETEEYPTELERAPSVALVAGCARYPWLACLLPPRPQHAIACTTCSGQGVLVLGEHRAFCAACGALGWTAAQLGH
jgi:hypothetical protein